MGEDHADVFAVILSFDKALHHLFPFAAGEVAGLRADNFDIRRFGNRVGEPFLTIDGHAGPNGALQFNDVTRLTVDGFHQPVANQLAFQHVVGGHGGHVEIFIFNINGTVEKEDRDLGLFRLFQHRFPAGGHHRCNEDRVDPLSDKGAHCFDLVFLFLLTISDLQGDTALGGLLFRDAGFRRTPAGFRTDLRKTYG